MSKAVPVGGSLLKQGIAEAIGTALFCFVSAGALSVTGNLDSEALGCTRIVLLSLLDGFLYYVLINLTMRLTDEDGGYVNPTITLSLAWLDTWFQWRQSWKFMLRALFLIVMQLAGAIGGTFMLLISMPDPMIGSEKTGYSHPTFGTTSVAAFGLEAIMGFLLTMVVLNVRRHETRRSSIMIALSYISIRLMSHPLTGGYANPARSFGPAAVSGMAGMQYIWIYLLASPIGAIVAVPVFLYLHKEVHIDSELQENES